MMNQLKKGLLYTETRTFRKHFDAFRFFPIKSYEKYAFRYFSVKSYNRLS